MNLSKVLKQKRDAEDRLRSNSPMPSYFEGTGFIDLSKLAAKDHTHNLTDLTDTPNSYVANKFIKVNSEGTAFEYGDSGGTIQQATETELGGIRAAEKTTEAQEVKIDTETGKLFVPVSGQAQNGLPAGGSTDQILAKNSNNDYDGKWIDAPSGGSSYANSIDKPPIIPNIKDDEFTSNTLNEKWFWVNQSTAIAVPNGEFLSFTAPKGGVACRGIVQTVPLSTDFTIVTKFLGCDYWNSYAKTGVLISESLTGKQLGIWHAYDNGWKGLMGEFFTTPSARLGFAYYGTPVLPSMGYIRVRIYQSSGVWYVDFYYSVNGYVWQLCKSALALGFTPAYIGLGLDFEISSGTTYQASFDWFRVTQL